MRTFLLDVDGVIADFVGATLDVTHDLTSLRFRREDLTSWEIFDHIKDPLNPRLASEVRKRIARKGFCENIRPLPGAKEGVKKLQTLGQVKCVTAPWKTSPTWCFERYEWLEHHFGIPHKDVIMAADKSNVHGDMMIDDKVSNVESWLAYHSLQASISGYPMLGVIWSTPHNQHDQSTGAVRANSWEHVYKWAKL